MTTDPLVVNHTVSFHGADADSVTRILGAKPGISDVRAEGDGRFRVTYDLRHLSLDDIEKAAEEAGARPSGGMLNALRRQWIRFTDGNLAANVSAPVSPCCNRPPKP